MMSLVHVNKHLSRIGGIIIEVTVKNASHAGRDDFQINLRLTRILQAVGHYGAVAVRFKSRLIRMTGVRPCPGGHSSTLEGPWSTCSTQPALPQNVAARLFPWTCHGVAFLPRCSVSPESAAQQSEVKLGDWCAGCVVACPTPSVSDMLH